MNVIIVGCGKVGYAIAYQLNEEGHEVTIIDSDSERLERASSSLDINCIAGNATVYSTLLEAGIKDSDVFIAVTDSDEINLLSCVIAKKATHCHTVARVRSPEYYGEISFLREELGISYAINPEFMTAGDIFRLIHLPSALEIATFAKGKVNLVKIKVPKGSILDNFSLMHLSSHISRDVLVCTVERNREIIIPDGSFVLQHGDIISLSMPIKSSYAFFNKIGIKTKPIKNVIIAGGGTISYYLATILLKNKVDVKIIEEDKHRCEFLSQEIPDATIINGSLHDKELLHEEGIVDADALVALTNFDEENIVFSLYSSSISKAKIITKISRSDFAETFNEHLGSTVCPRNIISETIVGYVRSLKNSIGSNVEALYKLIDNQVEALEFAIAENAKVIGIPLKKLSLKQNLLVCHITRGSKLIRPTGDEIIKAGDRVVIVTTNKGLDSIDDILEN